MGYRVVIECTFVLGRTPFVSSCFTTNFNIGISKAGFAKAWGIHGNARQLHAKIGKKKRKKLSKIEIRELVFDLNFKIRHQNHKNHKRGPP